MSQRVLAGGILSLLLASFVSSPAQAATRRIHIPRGHTYARVTGRLRGIHDQAYFVLHARRGQHLWVKITGRGPTRGVVLFPHGGQDGSPGGVVFDDRLTQTGDYRIRVTEDTMAEAWRGSFTLEVRLH